MSEAERRGRSIGASLAIALAVGAPVVASGGSSPNAFGPDLVLDDGGFEALLGTETGSQFLWLNRFSPPGAAAPFTIDRVEVFMVSDVGGAEVGDTFDVFVWSDSDDDPSNGATLLGSELGAQVAAVDDWTSVTMSPGIEVPFGDVLVGIVNRTVANQTNEYPAALDTSTLLDRSWVGIYAGNAGSPPTLSADALHLVKDVSELDGTWGIRAYSDLVFADDFESSGTSAWTLVKPI